MEKTTLQRPLLPVWKTVGETYRLVWQYKGEYFRIAWCWLAIAVSVLFLLNYCEQILPVFKIMQQKTSAGTQADAHGLQYFVEMFREFQNNFVELFFGVSIAVAWHRLILIKEQINESYYLRFDSIVRDYFLISAFFMLIEYVPYFSPALLWGMHGIFILLNALLTFVIFVAGLYFCARLSIILPARALGKKNIAFGEVLQRTRSNFWRLFWGSWVSTFPGFVIIMLFAYLSSHVGKDNPVIQALFPVLDMIICAGLVAPFYLVFLSLSFRHFFPEESEAKI